MIHLENVNKTYYGAQPLHVLKGIDLDIAKGEFVSIMGASGSGKSTLLNILGILDNYDSGLYELAGVPIKNLSETKAADYRNRMIGFIFQSFNLISFKTAVENVELPLFYQGVSRRKRHQMALEYLERLGLLDWAEHYPNELSGGQRQRVAIARALITHPQIILADEPTGALDSKTSVEVMQLLKALNQDDGMTIVVVTHESGVANETNKIVHIKDGVIGQIEENLNHNASPFGSGGLMKERENMRDIISEIWSTARRNKLRTTLTGFAVAWGIFMLIVLLGAGNGLINANLKQSNRFLSSSMVVYGGWTSKAYQGLKEGRDIRLHERDMEITKKEFSQNVDDVGAQYNTSVTVSNGQQYLSSSISGVYPNHTKINKVELLQGRFINEIDVKESRKVLVLSNKQAKELKCRVGDFVNVGNFAFKVVGIYKENENGRAEIFSSYSAIKRIYGAKTDDAGRIEFTFHGLPTEQANEEFEKGYRHRLNAEHQAHPEDEDAVWLWNRFTQNLQMEQGIGIIRTALWIVGLFTLLSGIVGVSNIMLITVKERTHEFGIRKAIGAKPWNVLKLIIIESVIITTFFGYIGMVLGIAANEYMDATIGHETIDTGLFKATMFLDPTVGLDVCLEATMVMIIAGTIAGLIPAFKASRIRPIEALRAE